jgi:hypothetical protein
VLGINDLKAIREDLNGWLIVIFLSQASLASLAAGRAPQVFVPFVFHGGLASSAPGMGTVIKALILISCLFGTQLKSKLGACPAMMVAAKTARRFAAARWP